jgi:hypothetical protein
MYKRHVERSNCYDAATTTDVDYPLHTGGSTRFFVIATLENLRQEVHAVRKANRESLPTPLYI